MLRIQFHETPWSTPGNNADWERTNIRIEITPCLVRGTHSAKTLRSITFTNRNKLRFLDGFLEMRITMDRSLIKWLINDQQKLPRQTVLSLQTMSEAVKTFVPAPEQILILQYLEARAESFFWHTDSRKADKQGQQLVGAFPSDFQAFLMIVLVIGSFIMMVLWFRASISFEILGIKPVPWLAVMRRRFGKSVLLIPQIYVARSRLQRRHIRRLRMKGTSARKGSMIVCIPENLLFRQLFGLV